jgi:hypothetical protein
MYREVPVKIFSSQKRFLQGTLFFTPFITLIHSFCNLNSFKILLHTTPEDTTVFQQFDSLSPLRILSDSLTKFLTHIFCVGSPP